MVKDTPSTMRGLRLNMVYRSVIFVMGPGLLKTRECRDVPNVMEKEV